MVNGDREPDTEVREERESVQKHVEAACQDHRPGVRLHSSVDGIFGKLETQTAASHSAKASAAITESVAEWSLKTGAISPSKRQHTVPLSPRFTRYNPQTNTRPHNNSRLS